MSGCWPIGRLLPTSWNEAIALGEAQHELPPYIPLKPSVCKRDLTLCRNMTSALPLTSHYTLTIPSPTVPPHECHKGKTNTNIKIKKMQGAGCCIRGNKKKAVFPHKQPYRKTNTNNIKNVMTWTLAFNTLIIQSNTKTRVNRGEVKCKRMMGVFFVCFLFVFSCRAWHTAERERNKQGGMRRMHEGE